MTLGEMRIALAMSDTDDEIIVSNGLGSMVLLSVGKGGRTAYLGETLTMDDARCERDSK
jgi:hypothetical protein